MARLFIKDASVKFVVPVGPIAGAVEYNCFVNTIELVTTPGDTSEYATMCDKIQQIGASTYAFHIVGVQDWGTGGLSKFLWDNAGLTARIVANVYGKAAAFAAATPGFDGQVILVEGNYGGAVNEWAEFDVELPCVSRPTIVTTTPTAEEASAPAEEAPAAAAA